MISTVLLAYKEEENLRVLMPRIKEALNSTGEEYEIIVIDTKEPLDNTRGLCEEEGALYFNQEDPGFGGAYRKGLSVIKGDKMLVLDSDGSHDPKYIPAMYKKFIEGYDVVIGSRYTKGGSTSDAKSSQVMSAILNFMFRLFLGIKAKDMSTNFRIYDTSTFKDIKLKCVNYDVLEEILLEMKLKKGKEGFRIAEVPIAFNKRIYGQSKRRLIPFIISYIKTLARLTARRIKGA
ncbi:MAG: glycosyltransferase [Clostridiales bacterium]|nr:glycosyltransferase [Clostridiales bacterium]